MYKITYEKKVQGTFPIDISLELLEQFHQINNQSKEHLKVHLFCKNEGSNSRCKRESIKKVCYMRFWFSKNNGWSRLNDLISIFHHLICCIKKQNMPQDAA